MLAILNWNTEIATPRGVNWRFETIRAVISMRNADIICLTEAYPETMPIGGYIVTSGLSGWERHERLGARKVVLWSRSPWTDVDDVGSARLPEGRFIRAVTRVRGETITVIGMCIPFHNYRYHESWGEKKMAIWQGAIEYLDALQEDILPQARYQKRTILIGDYKLQIPPKTYPYPSTKVNKKRETTFAGWSMPTAVDYRAVGLDKPMVDHIALTSDFRVRYMDFISRFSTDILSLSDHNGVCIVVDLP